MSANIGPVYVEKINPVKINSPKPVNNIVHSMLKKNPQIWHEETAQICSSAANFLSFRIKKPNDAIIFDIDGTLVANESHCILPVKYLYDIALSYGYHVFIITARAKTLGNELFTIIMLEKCGITTYDSIFMRPLNELNLFSFKESRRKAISDMGFHSVMSVGDMPFDFGAYGGLSIKIPEINV
jgi:predicted secreted acid phosphatase